MKKYAIVTMTGEDGGAATYFDTKEHNRSGKRKAERLVHTSRQKA